MFINATVVSLALKGSLPGHCAAAAEAHSHVPRTAHTLSPPPGRLGPFTREGWSAGWRGVHLSPGQSQQSQWCLAPCTICGCVQAASAQASSGAETPGLKSQAVLSDPHKGLPTPGLDKRPCPADASPLGQLGLRGLPTCSEKLRVAVGQVLTSPRGRNVGSVPAVCPQPVSLKLLHSGAFSSTAVVPNNYFKEKLFLHFKKFLGVCSYKFHLSYQRTI